MPPLAAGADPGPEGHHPLQQSVPAGPALPFTPSHPTAPRPSVRRRSSTVRYSRSPATLQLRRCLPPPPAVPPALHARRVPAGLVAHRPHVLPCSRGTARPYGRPRSSSSSRRFVRLHADAARPRLRQPHAAPSVRADAPALGGRAPPLVSGPAPGAVPAGSPGRGRAGGREGPDGAGGRTPPPMYAPRPAGTAPRVSRERRAPSRPFPAARAGRRRRVPSFCFVPGRRCAARFYVCRNKGRGQPRLRPPAAGRGGRRGGAWGGAGLRRGTCPPRSRRAVRRRRAEDAGAAARPPPALISLGCGAASLERPLPSMARGAGGGARSYWPSVTGPRGAVAIGRPFRRRPRELACGAGLRLVARRTTGRHWPTAAVGPALRRRRVRACAERAGGRAARRWRPWEPWE